MVVTWLTQQTSETEYIHIKYKLEIDFIII